MTQNTQTTVERLLALIANNQQTIRTGSIKLIDHGRAANLIAAEIDALKAEVATLTLKLASARLNLKHCSEEVEKRDECAEQLSGALESLNAWRTMFPVNTPAEIAAKLMRGG